MTEPKDRVRQKIGDTDPATALVQDETIQYYLDLPLGETAAAARLARDISAKFARDISFTVDGQGQREGDKSKQYAALAARLELEAASETPPTDPDAPALAYGGGVFVTGATTEDVMSARCDPARAANAPFRIP